jgi:hypothetical protein
MASSRNVEIGQVKKSHPCQPKKSINKQQERESE